MYPNDKQVTAVANRITEAAHKPALGREPQWTETTVTLTPKDAIFVHDFAYRVTCRLPMGWSIAKDPDSLYKLIVRR